MTEEINSQIAQMPKAETDGGKAEQKKEKFDFIKWVKGNNTQEFLENISYVFMVVAAILVSGGLLVGSFVNGVVIIASIGAFILLPSLVVYVISQLMLPDPHPEEEEK